MKTSEVKWINLQTRAMVLCPGRSDDGFLYAYSDGKWRVYSLPDGLSLLAMGELPSGGLEAAKEAAIRAAKAHGLLEDDSEPEAVAVAPTMDPRDAEIAALRKRVADSVPRAVALRALEISALMAALHARFPYNNFATAEEAVEWAIAKAGAIDNDDREIIDAVAPAALAAAEREANP